MIPDREEALYNLVSFLELVYERVFGGDFDTLVEGLTIFYQSYSVVAISISLFCLVGLVYSQVRIYQIRQEEEHHLKYGHLDHHGGGGVEHVHVEEDAYQKPGRSKWVTVERHINSLNPNDWRLAILEADIMLDALVREKGWVGENLGERLKNVARGDFQTIDKAWEAHRVRNAIAHEGGDFMLSEREAKRTINLFREVFEEFDFI